MTPFNYPGTSLGECDRCGWARGNCRCPTSFGNTFTITNSAVASSGIYTIYAPLSNRHNWWEPETDAEREARELREAIEARRLRHRAVLSERALERRHRRDEAPRVAPPPPAPPWQASVRAYRGRSGMG